MFGGIKHLLSKKCGLNITGKDEDIDKAVIKSRSGYVLYDNISDLNELISPFFKIFSDFNYKLMFEY